MDVTTRDTHARRSGFRRVPLWVLDLAVFTGTFFFHWLTVAFPSDHFVHLPRARQILLGDVPIRDFFDPGRFCSTSSLSDLGPANARGSDVAPV